MNGYYTCSDLLSEEFRQREPRARLAVIGNPIAHSKSPQLQQAALDAAGIPVSYIRVLAGEDEFETVVHRLRGLGFFGTNVTVPFKKRAWAMAMRLDPLAELSGSVNTFIFRGDEIEGANTDGPGFSTALRQEMNLTLHSRRIVLLGAGGGAGTSLACQCALERCAGLVLVNRTLEKLDGLCAQLARHRPGAVSRLSSEDAAGVIRAAKKAELLIQATSLGLREDDPLPLPQEALHPGLAVYDLVTHDTPLQRLARKRGLRVAGGEGMLLHQGIGAFRLWFPNREPDADAMAKALAAASES